MQGRVYKKPKIFAQLIIFLFISCAVIAYSLSLPFYNLISLISY